MLPPSGTYLHASVCAAFECLRLPCASGFRLRCVVELPVSLLSDSLCCGAACVTAFRLFVLWSCLCHCFQTPLFCGAAFVSAFRLFVLWSCLCHYFQTLLCCGAACVTAFRLRCVVELPLSVLSDSLCCEAAFVHSAITILLSSRESWLKFYFITAISTSSQARNQLMSPLVKKLGLDRMSCHELVQMSL